MMMKCEYCPASYSTEGEVHRHRESTGCRDRYEPRARAIRAVVAAQWAVACEWASTHAFLDEVSMLRAPDLHRAIAVGKANGAWHVGAGIALLPTAEQIVDGAA